MLSKKLNGNEKIINIVVTIDQNYYNPLKVMMYSLLKNNANYDFVLFLCHSSLPKDLVKEFGLWIESFGNIKFNELIIDTELFNGIQSVPHVTKETFYRLLLPSILPSDINRIMYLDPDIIIQEAISTGSSGCYSNFSGVIT